MHPMFRDGLLRRKMGPVIVNKNISQDRLIEELQGKFGIGRAERRRKQSDDWLTEGVVVTSKPQRFRAEGANSEVDKVGSGVPKILTYLYCSISFSLCFSFPSLQIIIPPESPVPVRKVLPPLSPPAPRRPPVIDEPKRPAPVQHQPVPTPPPLPPPPSSLPRPVHIPVSIPSPPRPIRKPSPPPAPIQEPPPPVFKAPVQPAPPVDPPVAPKVLVSVGCQTEYDPVFPPMQA